MADLENLSPGFRSGLEGLMADCGSLSITSGFRTVEHQAQLFEAAVAKYGSESAASKWVAPPGKSNHGPGEDGMGHAVDLGGDLDCAHAKAAQYGLHFPMDWEPWHIEPLTGSGGAGGYTTPPDETIAAATAKPPKPANYVDQLIQLMGGGKDPMLDGTNDYAAEIGGKDQPVVTAAPPDAAAGGGSHSTAGGDVDSWLMEAIRLTGVPESWIDGLRIIAEHESTNNPNDVNDWDSNAAAGHPSKGLMQTIDTTFNENKVPGYDDIFDPVANAAAAINYIKRRYGSIDNVPGVVSIRNGDAYEPY